MTLQAPATLGTGSDTAVRSALAALVDDSAALMRCAAYEALGTTGCPAAPATRAKGGRPCPTWPGRYGPAPPPPCPPQTRR